jgi:hypothetical protein
LQISSGREDILFNSSKDKVTVATGDEESDGEAVEDAELKRSKMTA